jgi:hypothetical protein
MIQVKKSSRAHPTLIGHGSKRTMVRNLLALLLVFLVTGPLLAQDDDLPISDIINYDDEVADTLTERAFWDWWILQANTGDVIVADMRAYEGLEPLIGILNPGGNLVARSADGEPGGTVSVEYTVPALGEYTIVTTRVGNELGTSTGPYELRVRRANLVSVRENPYQQVTFRCRDFEVANAATLVFDEGDQAQRYVVSVYGLEGFAPVIRLEVPDINLTDCSRDNAGMAGNVYALPDAEPITLTGDPDATAAQVTVSGAAQVGQVTLTIGSAGSQPGRFIAVIDGLAIGPQVRDYIEIGQGPLARHAPLMVYMIAHSQDRLDPRMAFIVNGQEGLVCDDAGRRGCEDMPSADGLRLFIAEHDLEIRGDRFDAGLVLPPGLPELYVLQLGSAGNRTTGRYALVLIGELPERETQSE